MVPFCLSFFPVFAQATEPPKVDLEWNKSYLDYDREINGYPVRILSQRLSLLPQDGDSSRGYRGYKAARAASVDEIDPEVRGCIDRYLEVLQAAFESSGPLGDASPIKRVHDLRMSRRTQGILLIAVQDVTELLKPGVYETLDKYSQRQVDYILDSQNPNRPPLQNFWGRESEEGEDLGTVMSLFSQTFDRNQDDIRNRCGLKTPELFNAPFVSWALSLDESEPQ